MKKPFIPVAPHNVVNTHTPLGRQLGTDWYRDKDGVMKRLQNKADDVVKSVVNTYRPTVHYVSTADFRYPLWRRIEETKTVYSMSGIQLLQAKKYTVELTKPLDKPEEQIDAIKQLIKATVEYGHVAPEPCTERWIDSSDEHLDALQHIRINLFNLFAEHDILESKDYDERKSIYDFLNSSSSNVYETLEGIEDLVTKYQYGMFLNDKKIKRYTSYINKKKKKKALTEFVQPIKVDDNKENTNAILH